MISFLFAFSFSGCTTPVEHPETWESTDNAAVLVQDSDLEPVTTDWLMGWWQKSPELAYFGSTWLGFSHWLNFDIAAEEEDIAETAADINLWDVVGENVSLALDDHPRIQKEANFYARNPRFLDDISVRAEPYFNFVLEEVQRRNMPVEVALLPAIESAYEPRATSHRHAAGLWQLIPGTARHWGLELNRGYDGRRDVFASTHAALDYLQKLNDDFEGDWLLTMAAYNCGEFSVSRAIRKNLAHGKPVDFWSLDLPAETRTFVPRILGLAAVIAQPTNYGIKLRKLRNLPLISVPIDYRLDLTQVAEISDVPLSQLRRLNPAYNKGKSIAAGGNVLLPASHAEAFEERLAELDPTELSPEKEEISPPDDDKPQTISRHKMRKNTHSARRVRAHRASAKANLRSRSRPITLAKSPRRSINAKNSRRAKITIIAQNRSENRASPKKSARNRRRS